MNQRKNAATAPRSQNFNVATPPSNSVDDDAFRFKYQLTMEGYRGVVTHLKGKQLKREVDFWEMLRQAETTWTVWSKGKIHKMMCVGFFTELEDEGDF